jgi:hypothetical protein
MADYYIARYQRGANPVLYVEDVTDGNLNLSSGTANITKKWDITTFNEAALIALYAFVKEVEAAAELTAGSDTISITLEQATI